MPIHDLLEKMSADIIEILPAAHALTGCDSTSKTGTKAASFKTVNACCYELRCFLVNINNERDDLQC